VPAALAICLACIGLATVSAQQVGAPSGSGPYPAIAESRAELPRHTVYRPVEMPRTSMPLYVWGNGGCSANGLAHAAYLRQIASLGYVIVALGTPGGATGGAPAGAARGATGAPAARGAGASPADNGADPTEASQMIEAIEWAERETARDGSPFSRRIDVTKIAVGGHSCGGLQALSVSHDPRIDTTLVLDSGIYNQPGTGRSRIKVEKSQLTRLHSPVLYLLGGPSDIAYPNATDDVARIDRVPVFFGSLPVGHGGTFAAPDGGDWAKVSGRWLDWQLKSDADAGLDFAGPDCRLCKDTRWEVVQKQLPAPPAAPRTR
jgi:hypothetical protein